MTLTAWLALYVNARFRTGMYSTKTELTLTATKRIDLVGMGFNTGDILCVPHGPWMYHFGIVAVDEHGRITKHELLSAH